MAAILTPFVDRRIYEVATAMARLGDVEIWQKDKVGRVVRPVKTTPRAHLQGESQSPRPAAARPVKVSQRQMWFDLLAAGVSQVKIEQQPHEVLLALWTQLSPEQKFTKPPKVAACEVWLQDFFD